MQAADLHERSLAQGNRSPKGAGRWRNHIWWKLKTTEVRQKEATGNNCESFQRAQQNQEEKFSPTSLEHPLVTEFSMAPTTFRGETLPGSAKLRGQPGLHGETTSSGNQSKYLKDDSDLNFFVALILTDFYSTVCGESLVECSANYHIISKQCSRVAFKRPKKQQEWQIWSLKSKAESCNTSSLQAASR